ncbi:HK97 gp10 family phage protein [Rhizobium ruizarguesonis]|uniref:HK97 gp10 family phage protein n=1 Tax=Rhizobium ruizarguesonis TaxID=2081791 RepID=UPI00102F4C50|nr:HK97 gp10 family phage protein [Rhizobium ruizarguesonis]TBE67420.1 HK97 gp10 family phage protein [Rhizobium ruizarguesonis]
MAQSAFQFALSLDRLAEQLTDEVMQQVTQKLALQALSGVVLKSPVKSGRFRGNWNVSIDTADRSVSDATDQAGGATVTRGAAVINAVPPYRVIWLSNNLPYARRLETGWSKQAPAGVVALTLAELESQLR